MTYTEEAKQALSLKVAEKCGIEDGSGEIFSGRDSCGNSVYKWLHDDWHTIMELCVKHGVNVEHGPHDDEDCKTYYAAEAYRYKPDIQVRVAYKDCASPSEAERIARLLALLEV